MEPIVPEWLQLVRTPKIIRVAIVQLLEPRQLIVEQL